MIGDMRGLDYVYEMAFELERELKEASESLERGTTTGLVRRIVSVLEELERHALLYEDKRQETDRLRAAIKKMEEDGRTREQERLDYEQDLVKLEESWHAESMELIKTMEKLQEENTNMKMLIEKASEKSRIKFNKRLSHQLEIKSVHLKLKESIDNQVQEIKLLKKELAQKCVDFDAIQQQCLNLSNINAEICEKHCNNKLISKRLIEEKANLEAQIIINNKSIKGNNDDVFLEEGVDIIDAPDKGQSDINFSWEEVKDFLQDCRRLKSEVNEKEEQLMIYRPSIYDEGDVQGPINKEPVDKMSPSFVPDSGIRKYFQKLLVGIKL